MSIRFLTSTADSSWAVPSDVSRSSSALTTAWTAPRASQMTTAAMTTMSRIGRIDVLRERDQLILEGLG